MKIKIMVIDFEVPARIKRRALAVGIPVAILAGAGAVAYADVKHTFKSGDVLKAADLNENFDELDQRIAALEQGVVAAVDPPCPAGYVKDASPASPFNPASVLCTEGQDEVVKVGAGASAFWIDRHEASIWTAPDGPVSGAQKFDTADDSSATFPKNGQITAPLYALSVTAVGPSRFVTWFQAAEACLVSGKRLPTGPEWLAAARGTRDPGASDGAASNKCNTQGSGRRQTGKALGSAVDTSCVSDWGAQDMIGNMWEWTAEWYAGPATSGVSDAHYWPNAPSSTFNGDITWNISSFAFYNPLGYVQGIPAAASRGGYWTDGAGAGIFALNVSDSPALHHSGVGFRCVVPR
jgi:formylglycine-generating enzyme required for sulfatase activity